MFIPEKLLITNLLIQCLVIDKINSLKCYFCQNCATGQTQYVMECPKDVKIV